MWDQRQVHPHAYMYRNILYDSYNGMPSYKQRMQIYFLMSVKT